MTAYPPMISPRFQVSGDVLQYKPYPAYPSWLDAWDIGGLVPPDIEDQIADINDAIAALQDEIDVLTATDEALAGLIVTMASDVATSLTQSGTALVNAANAQTAADAAQATADEALAAAGGIAYPDCALLFPQMFRTISVGFAAATLQSGHWLHQYSSLNAGEVELNILLASGDYDFTCGYVKHNAAPKLGVGVDSNTPVEFDMYNSTTQLAQQITGTLITGLTAGLHTIKLTTANRNVSSSGFNALVSFLAIRKKP